MSTVGDRPNLAANVLRAIANRHWVRRAEPFPHVIAENVFTEPTYRRFEAAFEEVLRTYFAKHPDTFTFKMANDLSGPFALFISRAWHDLLATLMGVTATGDVDAGLHHHDGGGNGGHVHNDLNPGYFTGSGPAGGCQLAQAPSVQLLPRRYAPARAPRARHRACGRGPLLPVQRAMVARRRRRDRPVPPSGRSEHRARGERAADQ